MMARRVANQRAMRWVMDMHVHDNVNMSYVPPLVGAWWLQEDFWTPRGSLTTSKN